MSGGWVFADYSSFSWTWIRLYNHLNHLNVISSKMYPRKTHSLQKCIHKWDFFVDHLIYLYKKNQWFAILFIWHSAMMPTPMMGFHLWDLSVTNDNEIWMNMWRVFVFNVFFCFIFCQGIIESFVLGDMISHQNLYKAVIQYCGLSRQMMFHGSGSNSDFVKSGPVKKILWWYSSASDKYHCTDWKYIAYLTVGILYIAQNYTDMVILKHFCVISFSDYPYAFWN